MTTLSKEDVVRMAEQAGALLPGVDFESAGGSVLQTFATLVRADLVADNERLKEMAMFFSTYTDPDELEMDEIENAARESFRRANSGVRGTTITRANSYESHVIWATKARISKELTATRTALAAAEADNERLQNKFNVSAEFTGILSDLDLVFENKELRNQLAAAEARETKLRDELEFIRQLPSAEQYRINGIAHQALAQPRDDSALREMIAGVYEECANVTDNVPIRVGNAGIWGVEVKNAIRALAEKARHGN